MPIPCRSIASSTCSRHAGRERDDAARRIASTARSRQAKPIRSGRWLDRRRPRSAKRDGRGEGADPGRRHRPLFQGADRRPCPGPRHSAEMSREYWRERAERLGPRGAASRACRRAIPAMAARLRPSDPQRIVRALEVIDATGISLAEWQGAEPTPVLASGGVGEARHRAGAGAALCRRSMRASTA